MRRIFRVFWAAALVLALTACSTSPDGSMEHLAKDTASSVDANTPDHSETPDTEMTITLTVGDKTFTATLLDNETARQLVEQFPLTVDMRDLNGNEKYFYLDTEFPTDAYQPGQIDAGDLMLYGNNCLVLFYESFSSSYSYTRLGSIDDSAGLAETLGTGSVTVTFSVEDSK